MLTLKSIKLAIELLLLSNHPYVLTMFSMTLYKDYHIYTLILIDLIKTEWCGTGLVICLE